MKEIIGNIIRSTYYKTGYMDEFQEETGEEVTSLMLSFMEWLIRDQQVFWGELSEEYLVINDNIYIDGHKLSTFDEFFEYWYKNIKK